jgi:hypothetical protein
MQPKRHVSYRLLKKLGIALRLTYGMQDEYAQIEIINSPIATSISRIWLVYRGVPVTTRESKQLSVEALTLLSPEEANSLIWKELKEFYLRNKGFGNGEAISLDKEVSYRIDDYCVQHGLSNQDSELLKIHALKLNDIVESNKAPDFDSDLDDEIDPQKELPL